MAVTSAALAEGQGRPVSTAPSGNPDPQAALFAEWAAASPQTPNEIAAFYRDAEHYGPDLDAWHQTPARRAWTDALVGAARTLQAERVVDIGCGLGHDLKAVRAALPHAMLFGVEPNRRMRALLAADADADVQTFEAVARAPVEVADLIACFDVLEHVPDPEAFLTGIATRARLGCTLVETTATHDLETPLHLNPGWHPGHALEAAGWALVERRDRLRVWQRVNLAARPVATLALSSWRAISIPTQVSVLNLAGINGEHLDELDDARLTRVSESPWRIQVKSGDGLISRSRSIVVSRWWAETASDVLLFVDDDIAFEAADAERLVAHCRETRSIVCAAYPVGDGSHAAVRGFDGRAIDWEYEGGLVEIEYGATGFMAIHRDVVDALVPTLPLVHADTEQAWWPLFACVVAPMGRTNAYLSEDWSFCLRARHLGFPTWLDTRADLQHMKEIPVTMKNMHLIREAIRLAKGGG